jgi:hypothetical protein
MIEGCALSLCRLLSTVQLAVTECQLVTTSHRPWALGLSVDAAEQFPEMSLDRPSLTHSDSDCCTHQLKYCKGQGAGAFQEIVSNTSHTGAGQREPSRVEAYLPCSVAD